MSLFVPLELVALPPVWFAIAQQVYYLQNRWWSSLK
jgi:hypothetical protein